MPVDTKAFLDKQRKRATGAVLGFAERSEWYGSLHAAEKADLRDKVLSAMAAYHDAVLDVISTLDGAGGVHNERALELLESLHQEMVSPGREHPLRATRGR